MNKVCEHESENWICKKCGATYHSTIKINFHIEENLSQINKQQWEDIKDEWLNSKEFDFDYVFVFKWLKENYTAPDKK